MEIRSGVSEPQGVEIWPLPLLWLFAFTTACATVQAVTSRDKVDVLRVRLTELHAAHQNLPPAIFAPSK